MASLPKSFNLAEPIPTLPDGAQSQLITCRPISGASFTPQSIIEVDLGNRGWCDPQSIAIRYKVSVTTAASSSTALIGTPVYTPFQRVSTLIGGSSIDSISGFNQVAHVLTTGLDVAQKYGLQSQYCYQTVDDAASQGSMENMDSRLLLAAAGAEEVYYAAAPLIGTLLTNSEKCLPLFAMPQVRFQFTLDSLANMCYDQQIAFKPATAFTITNFELVYTMTDLGSAVEKMVYDMGPTISIKTHGFSNSAVSVASGTVGSQSYVFNQRFASIRSAFVCPNKLTNSRWAEFADLTGRNGSYQLLVGNQAFPQSPLSTVLNDSGILQETRRAFGNIFDKSNSFSINTNEWKQVINTASNNAALSPFKPGKFIVGVNLDKVQSGDHVLMAGASTYNTPISVNVDIGTAMTQGANLNLILDYDAILVLDSRARQLSVRA
jgi:hypothetical protein